MTDKKNERNLDPERMGQHDENESVDDQKFNAGGNASDFDGGHPEDSQPESDDRIKNGEKYARRQHGNDEIE